MKVSDSILRIYYENLRRIEEENRRREERKQEKVKIWKSKGNALVFPDQVGAWEVYVDNRARDMFDGADIEDALSVMQALEDGVSVTDAVQVFADSRNDRSYDKIIAQTVGYFSKQGVEFLKKIYEDVFKENLGEPFMNFLNQIEHKNQVSLENLQKASG